MPHVKYPSLNGLRAISILLVIISHSKEQLGAVVPFFSKTIELFPILIDGQLGVNVFFIISGFLITTLLMQEEINYGKISLKKFYTRRTLRIFPAYYFMLLVYFIMQLSGTVSFEPMSWLTSITYTKYFNWQLDYLTAHAWSLSIEEHFYLMWPLFFILGKKAKLSFLYGAIFLSPLLRSLSVAYNIDWMNSLTIFLRLDSIALGCLIALYQKRFLEKFIKYRNWFFYPAIGWLLIYPFLSQINSTFNLPFGIFLRPFAGSIGTFTNLAIAIIMLHTVFHQKGLYFKFLNLKLLDQIGILSYSLYLWQQLFTSDLNVGNPIFPFNLLFLVLASLFSYYIIEKPFLKLKKRFSV